MQPEGAVAAIYRKQAEEHAARADKKDDAVGLLLEKALAAAAKVNTDTTALLAKAMDRKQPESGSNNYFPPNWQGIQDNNYRQQQQQPRQQAHQLQPYHQQDMYQQPGPWQNQPALHQPHPQSQYHMMGYAPTYHQGMPYHTPYYQRPTPNPQTMHGHFQPYATDPQQHQPHSGGYNPYQHQYSASRTHAPAADPNYPPHPASPAGTYPPAQGYDVHRHYQAGVGAPPASYNWGGDQFDHIMD